jgi:hypothetical protein
MEEANRGISQVPRHYVPLASSGSAEPTIVELDPDKEDEFDRRVLEGQNVHRDSRMPAV